MLGLSPFLWLLALGMEQLGPKMIPTDLIEILGYDHGWMVWNCLKFTAMSRLGWGCAAFWIIWYIGIFGRQPLLMIPTEMHYDLDSHHPQITGR